MARLEADKERRTSPNGQGDPVLAGPLADILSEAMNSEGIPFDVRRRILRRLYKEALNGDTYASQLLRTTAEPSLASRA